MSAIQIDHRVLRDPSWWHWIATIPFLILSLSGEAWAIGVATALCVAAMAYFVYHTRAIKPYPVQIRIAYLAWMVVGVLPWMGWMHWIQLAGTSAMVTVGYCPLARLLNLLPFNRSEPLTWRRIGRTFFRDPCSGGLFCRTEEAATPATCSAVGNSSVATSCSLFHHKTIQENPHASVH